MKKRNRETRDLVLAMSIGDGCITSNGYLSFIHGKKQKEYLEWKIWLLHKYGITTTKVEKFNNNGYIGYRARTYTHNFIKVFRRILYKPSKNIANRKILNRLTPLGIAIWYMDDGGLSQKKRNGIVHANELMLNTGLSKEDNQIIIDYFKEVWNIKFNQYKNKGVYRLACGTKEARKFVEIVKPYVEQVPSMLYKINVKSLSTTNNI